MFFNGDRIQDKEYLEIFNNIFKENAKITQSILKKINNLPFKTLRRLLTKALRSNQGARFIAKIVEYRLMAM